MDANEHERLSNITLYISDTNQSKGAVLLLLFYISVTEMSSTMTTTHKFTLSY